MQKYATKLPKDDLKKFAKQIGKDLVASDFKNNRVEDPTKISENQEKKVKRAVREYFDKAVRKRVVRDAKLADSKKREKQANPNGNGTNGKDPKREDTTMSSSPDVVDDENVEVPSPTASPSGQLEMEFLKRKRDNDNDEESPSENKRVKEESETPRDSSTPPPPPPPPPAEGMPVLGSGDHEMSNGHGGEVKEETEEEKELRMQEEDLMRENEEAMKMEMETDPNGTLKTGDAYSQHIIGEGMGVHNEATKGGDGADSTID